MELQAFGLINWLVLGAYLCANIVLGFVLSKKVTTADDFFCRAAKYSLVGYWYFQLSLPM